MLADPTSPPAPGTPVPSRRESETDRYFVAVGLTIFAILSQYFVPQLLPPLRPLYATAVSGLLIVYGVPIASFLLLVGTGPLKNWRVDLPNASVEGLRWYGLFSLLSIVVLFVLAIVYTALDPSALKLLSKPNPVLAQAASDPWFWVAFSFVIGAVEETIFRGWIFGYWLERAPADWKFHAIWTSALFAAVHLYYGVTYLAAAPLTYAELFLAGLALAYAFRYSRGCLVVVALLHGANDASAFLAGTVSPIGGDISHFGLIVIGLVVALVVYLREQARLAPPPPYLASSPPTFWNPPAFPYPPPPPPAYDPASYGPPPSEPVIPPPFPPPPGFPPPPP